MKLILCDFCSDPVPNAILVLVTIMPMKNINETRKVHLCHECLEEHVEPFLDSFPAKESDDGS